MTLLSGGCTKNDSPDESGTLIRTMSIRMAAPQVDSTTDNELINDWWMVFVNQSNQIQLILDRPVGLSGAVSYEEVEFSIPQGSYTIYAFANLTREDLSGLGLVLAEGGPMPDLNKIKWHKVEGNLVPMTGKLEKVRISNTASDHFTVEVVRLWAKLRFEFTTDAGKDVTVTDIKITPALTDKVTFLPDYAALGKAPVLPEGASCSEMRLPAVNLSVPAGGEVVDKTFYLLESTAAGHPTGHYLLTFDLQRADGTSSRINAMAYELTHINRNDFVTIPVLITDWKVDLNVVFYPPIGGYPAVLTESKDDEFYARFGSGGKFVIRPTVTNSKGEHVPEKDLEITLETKDPEGVLGVQPVRDPKTSEITGEIKDGVKGTAYVDLTIRIKEDALKHEIFRRFYIIRQ